MIAHGFVILASCVTAIADAALPPLPRDGCGPECLGNCVAGACLFGDGQLDDAYSLSSPSADVSQGPSALSQLEALGMMRTSGDYLSRHQSTNSAEFLTEAPLDYLGTGREQQLNFELQRVNARENALKLQNQHLQQLLAQWKRTGLTIAEREKQAAAMLGRPLNSLSSQSRLASSLPATAATAAATAATVPTTAPGDKSRLSMLQAFGQRFFATGAEHTYLRLCLHMVCVLFAIMCLWRFCCFIKDLRKGETSIRSFVAKSLPTGPSCQRLRNMMGMVEHRVEISDIYLGSLFAGSSDVRVTFRMGNGVERRTKVPKNKDGTFLRFDDVVELSVRSCDAACTLVVSDRRGELAYKELATAELVRLASRPHQQYFRTELMARDTLDPSSEASVFNLPDVPKTPQRRPYIAMRLRSINSGPAPDANARSSEQRAYGSFAV